MQSKETQLQIEPAQQANIDGVRQSLFIPLFSGTNCPAAEKWPGFLFSDLEG